MLRSEFEQHPLWQVLDAIDERLNTIASDGELSEVSPSELTRALVSHVRSFKALSTTSPLLFSNQMLVDVQNVYNAVLNQLDTRIATGQSGLGYLQNAMAQAESSLIVLAPWPRPYAKGAQIQATTTMFEGLLETQRLSVGVLEQAHQRLREQVAELSASSAEEHAAVTAQLTSILAEAEAVAATVDAEKARIDEVVNDGLRQISQVEKENTERYRKWQEVQAEAFQRDFRGLRDAVEADRDTAAAVLTELKETNQQFVNLSTLAAGDLIAGAFKGEARWGRIAGLTAYGIGFVFLGLGAIPLLLLLRDDPDTASGAPDWGRIIVRVSIAVLAGSAATVVIRLGARLVGAANRSKRMDLELRSFGPFLANVTESSDVDAARIELLGRAFGNSYGEGETESKEDVVPVSAFTQAMEILSRFAK